MLTKWLWWTIEVGMNAYGAKMENEFLKELDNRVNSGTCGTRDSRGFLRMELTVVLGEQRG